MNFETLTKKNFLIYCIQHYDNPHCVDIEEFYEDMKRIKYIKKLFTRYKQDGDLKERLILNHIIILHNVFGIEPLIRILFYKMKDYLSYIKPFLIYINILPQTIVIDGKIVYTDDIPMDNGIIEALRKL
jgi:hypothetical protein